MKRLLFLLVTCAGCRFPSEPQAKPPCKWVALYDQNGKHVADTLAPGQTVGVIVTCDKTKRAP